MNLYCVFLRSTDGRTCWAGGTNGMTVISMAAFTIAGLYTRRYAMKLSQDWEERGWTASVEEVSPGAIPGGLIPPQSALLTSLEEAVNHEMEGALPILADALEDVGWPYVWGLREVIRRKYTTAPQVANRPPNQGAMLVDKAHYSGGGGVVETEVFRRLPWVCPNEGCHNYYKLYENVADAYYALAIALTAGGRQ
jgi:hypothetical protein